MHINSMPDLVLRLIFSKVPLQDLLIAGRVCSLWKFYQMETCKQVRSLTMLIGPTDTQSLITNSCFTLKYRDLLLNDDGTRMYSSQYLHKFFHLTFRSFSLDGVEQLSNIFPCITTFEIAIKLSQGQIVFNPMTTLLTKWSPMLKSLKIYLQYHMNNRHNEINEFQIFLAVINLIPSLDHFTLDTDASISNLLGKPLRANYFNRPIYYSMDLPILGQLREFFCKSSDIVNVIEKSLQRYAVPNDNLKQLGLHYPSIEHTYPRFPQLASKIVYLPSHSFIFKPLISLIKLNLFITFGNEQSNNALETASSLRHLTHLHLTSVHFQASSQLSLDLFPQFQSVQVLTLSIILKSTSDLESNNWAYIFPNVQVIELVINVFGTNLPLPNGSEIYLSKKQLYSTLSTFVQCPKLRHIYTLEEYPQGQPGNEYCLITEWIPLKVRDRKIIIKVEK